MMQITIDLPASLAKLPPQERESIIRAGFYEALRTRRCEVEGEVEKARAHL